MDLFQSTGKIIPVDWNSSGKEESFPVDWNKNPRRLEVHWNWDTFSSRLEINPSRLETGIWTSMFLVPVDWKQVPGDWNSMPVDWNTFPVDWRVAYIRNVPVIPTVTFSLFRFFQFPSLSLSLQIYSILDPFSSIFLTFHRLNPLLNTSNRLKSPKSSVFPIILRSKFFSL